MGFDIYLNKKKAAAIGITAQETGTYTVPQWYTDSDGEEQSLPESTYTTYGIFVDNIRVECSNVYVDQEYIGWRSGPTGEVYERMSEKDYNVSY